MDAYGASSHQDAQQESFDVERQEGQREELPNIDHNASSAHPGFRARLKTSTFGSRDNIGWLNKNVTSTEDQTRRFGELLDRILKKHELRSLSNYSLLFIPGLSSNFATAYFEDTLEHFSKMGVHCEIAKIKSQAGVDTNAEVVKTRIEEIYRNNGNRRVLLLGHSKGGLDAAAACSRHWKNNLENKVEGLVFAQSPYGGSPVASDLLSEGIGAKLGQLKAVEFIYTKLFEGSIVFVAGFDI